MLRLEVTCLAIVLFMESMYFSVRREKTKIHIIFSALLLMSTVNLIFMDHMMPDMNGVEATKYLRQMQDEYYQKVPVIALTADAIRESQKLFADVGMNDFTTKPIDMLQICQVLRKWLPKNLVIKTQKSPFERE